MCLTGEKESIVVIMLSHRYFTYAKMRQYNGYIKDTSTCRSNKDNRGTKKEM